MILLFDAMAFPLQIASCFFLTGVISVIQLIHYPSFAQIDRKHFAFFHLKHTRALGIIAGLGMGAELLSAIWILKVGSAWVVLNLVGVLLLWLITAFISVPLHNRLASGFDEEVFRSLVRTNWFRTSIWLIRSIGFLVWMASLKGEIGLVNS